MTRSHLRSTKPSMPSEMKLLHQVQALDGDCYCVSLSDGRYTVSCFVSSMHLVEDKRPQLERALQVMQQQQQE